MQNAQIEKFLPLKPRVSLMLLTLRDSPAHGYRLMHAIEERSGGTARMDPGLVYRTLVRLGTQGLIKECPPPGDSTDRRRRYYRLTEVGRRVVDAEVERQQLLLGQLQAAPEVGRQ